MRFQSDRVFVSVEVRSRAAASTLFSLVKDGSAWPACTLFETFELERRGNPDPLGIGAIRVFSTRLSRAREEVTCLVEGRELGYRLLSGLPLRDYRAKVLVVPDGSGGSTLRWSAQFGPQPFGTGLFWRLFIRSVLRRTARDLTAVAERREGSGST